MGEDTMVRKVLVADDDREVEPICNQRVRREVRAGVYEFSFALSEGQDSEVLQEHSDIQTVITDLNVSGNLSLPPGVEARRDWQVVAPASSGRF